ncbi:MAG: 2-amino-4-hydroxy-6-hydroxymethyldihydropteridine diphosphokinase [Petroclostridium sp.]|jgi:2-amino-4-hydroxy-6-hydroxymethyldihydropteridine diphosphokinase|uniref:2-amino-4-hydroxy-6- hydroxymethyldihydropteridine diphosphokinase n=1 Tax=Petroclostridium xylanilyticum TaxID=1792311 RepID=UPI000B98926F|nr:2-amino-4-hydroxy-6-hydroxymethyldihydropteridine diphosphokinase [Petroclostridium xylanilyticum]MBZ4644925.1 folK [Clostridia bacterium]MDK2810150.1 2-amino-4-hydroxy-6-hydroxymethyldihydropteridine diphosphokinase [Petroclostridium sp.]
MYKDKIKAYLGIGSNIGDRQSNLDAAVGMLRHTRGIEIRNVSSFYNTAPVGYTAQPDFLNGVVEIETILTPHELLKICQTIEDKLKRVRTIRWGPRTIDIDILLYDELIIQDENLIIPHPHMHQREFVLQPLNDIAPEVIHPVFKMTVCKLYERLKSK